MDLSCTTGRGRPRPSGRAARIAAVLGTCGVLGGCSVLADPVPAPVHSTFVPRGPIGYVVCPTAVTPVELATRTAEDPITLPVVGTPALGDDAIATSADGKWAYVVTRAAGSGRATENVVIPIDLATQQASRPIPIPGDGGTHAIAVLPNGIVLAASGSTVVPVNSVTGEVGTPLDIGAGRTIFGMALSPTGPTLYVLFAGGVVPVDTANATAGPVIPTGLAVSSVYSPHGVVVSADGSTVYVAGQGGADYGGRVLPIVAATGAVRPATGFDRFGISDPAAVAVTADGSRVMVVDSANNWVMPISVAAFSTPGPPIAIPQRPGGAAGTGTDHPTDIVVGPGTTGAFIVDGFDTVVPFDPVSQRFGRPIPVCSGASSMAIAGTS